jgi:integrase
MTTLCVKSCHLGHQGTSSQAIVGRCFNDAAIKAGIGPLGTHTLRHTYRSWMDSVGTPIAVQQKLMRHSDIRTTMNVYGDVVDDRMKEAHSKVAALVFTSPAPEKGNPAQRSDDSQ